MKLTRRQLRNAAIAVAMTALVVWLIVGAVFPPKPTNPTPSAPTASVSPTGKATASTAPPGTYPALAKGTVTAGAGGTRTGPGGLSIGYPQTPDGAVAAATNFLMASMSSRTTTADGRAALLSLVTQRVRGEQERAMASLAQLQQLAPFQFEPARGAYAVLRFDGNDAQVAIWSPSFYPGRSDFGQDASVWGPLTIKMSWVDGDWMFDQAASENLVVAVRKPANPGSNPTAEEKAALLHDPASWTQGNDMGRFSGLEWLEYANAAR